MEVPFLDLKAQYNSIKDEVHESMQQVLDRTAFAGGPFVEQFEESFATYCQTKYAVGVSNGTAAIWLALAGLGIGRGDEVITTANTFIATAEAISFAGATPVLVDINETTHNMDPEAVEAAITPQTKAIIPVHLFGQMADLDPIMKIARKHNLYVVEDASQSHGATYNGRRAGSIGDVGCFSFYPGKNLGAYGEAGGVVTNDAELAAKIKMIRDHGQSKKYIHKIIGWNGRMDGIQGAVLSVKLKYIDQWNELRRQHAREYSNMLASVPGIVTPTVASYGTHVFHIYAIRMAERDEVMRQLRENGVACGIHYPVPVHMQEAYAELNYKAGDFPVAEKCASEYISLPMFPELTPSQILHVTETLKQIAGAQHADEVGGDGHASSYTKTSIVS